MQTLNKGGDVLARGGVRMDSAPGAGVSKEKWDQIFGEEDGVVKKAVYVFKCPIHGIFAHSKKEFFLSGGYPQLDESITSECLIEDCDEVAVYSGFQPA